MFTLFVILHLLAGSVLILVVLLQSGKAGDLASAFGGAGTQTAFGSRSATTLLTKATGVAAILFMCTSLGLSVMSTAREGTIMEDVPVSTEQSAQPAPAPVPPAEAQTEQPPAQPQPPPQDQQ